MKHKSTIMFVFGLGVGCAISLVILILGTHAGGPKTVSVSKTYHPGPVPDRVQRVVTDWSGSDNFLNSDELKVVWDHTRNSGGHDYPFDRGGSDSLAKMLNTEFKHPPVADFKVTPQHFAPTGNIKTVANLVETYTVHVKE